jgi:hypothetical protein
MLSCTVPTVRVKGKLDPERDVSADRLTLYVAPGEVKGKDEPLNTAV